MKKLILFIILFFAVSAYSGTLLQMQESIIAKKKTADPCTTMGASGTYDHWWNGQYAADTDKACQASGVSTADGVATAGVIVDDGGGDYVALLNADGEEVRWPANSTDVDAAGTVEISLTTPGSFSHDQTLFEIYTTTGNYYFRGYYSAGGDTIILYINSPDAASHAIAAPAESTTVTLQFSWDDASNALAIKNGAGAWDIDSEEWATTNNPNYYSLGEDNVAYVGGTDGWKIRTFKVRDGYEAS